MIHQRPYQCPISATTRSRSTATAQSARAALWRSPMCTPLTDDGELDLPSIHSLIEHLIAGGVHGIFALGSTGKFAALTGRQRQVLLETTVEAVGGRVP